MPEKMPALLCWYMRNNLIQLLSCTGMMLAFDKVYARGVSTP
jgi:hypothetical protein